MAELGSGVGITGAVAGEYCRRRGVGTVTVTDGMEDVMELLRRNVGGGGDGRVRVERNFWMEGERNTRYGVVFGSDLVYERRGKEMVESLGGEVKRILEVTVQGDHDEGGGGVLQGGQGGQGGQGERGDADDSDSELDVTPYAYPYVPHPSHRPFILFLTRRSYPLPLLINTLTAKGLTYKGLAEGGQRDIFDNDIDGLSDLWRDAVLVFVNSGE
ncbi:hypothetical protein TrRE_jg2484, partial [Triparma retinervis]